MTFDIDPITSNPVPFWMEADGRGVESPPSCSGQTGMKPSSLISLMRASLMVLEPS